MTRYSRKYEIWLAGILCAVSLLLEIFIFNYRYWESLNFTPVESAQITAGDGIGKLNNGQYVILNQDDAYIELTDIDMAVKNLYLSVQAAADYIPVRISIADSANSSYVTLPETELVRTIPESRFIRLYTEGITSKIRVKFDLPKDGIFIIDGVGINQVRPFHFNVIRFLGLIGCGFLILLFRLSSGLYRVEVNWAERRQRMIILIAFLITVAGISAVGYAFHTKRWQETNWKADLQYDYLTESLLEGHAYLDEQPPKAFEQLENPYDMNARNAALQATGETYIMDAAYYHGKYYCYFGIVPVLLFFLPYRIVTGSMLNPAWVNILLDDLFVAAVFWFLYTLFKKYFRHISLGVYLILAEVMVAASQALYAVQMPTIYSIPFIAGMAFNLFGITCWIRADGNSFRKIWLFAGSVLIALVMGTRPQLAITCLLFFAVFQNKIRQGEVFSTKGLPVILITLAPFLVTGAGLMYYNWIRFANPFDFGAQYNLTGFDMTRSGFVPARFFLGYFEYFLQPLNVKPVFPYLYAVAPHMGLQSDFQGQVINEPVFGGYFAFNIIGLFSLGVFYLRKQLRQAGVWTLGIMSLIFAFIIAAVDIQMVGMTLRYLMDISMFMTIPSVLVLASLLMTTSRADNGRIIHNRTLLISIIILALLCLGINYFSLFADGRYNDAKDKIPEVYFWIKYYLFMAA